jgi:phosphoglycerol transferase
VALRLAQEATSRFYGWPQFRNARRACCGALVCILFWDLGQRPLQTISAQNDVSYRADLAYFPALEASLPAGTQVFNAPHMTFPEGRAVTLDYDAFRFFVHTRTMRGSYGALRNSPEDTANRNAWDKMAAGDAETFIAYLRERAFAGVLLDRRLLGADSQAIEARLRAGFALHKDSGGDFVYFALTK